MTDRKICSKCKLNKLKIEFSLRSKFEKRLRSHCKLCQNIASKIKYSNLSTEDKCKRVLNTYKKRKNLPKDKKETIKLLRNQNNKERYRADIEYKLRDNLRSRLNKAIKNCQKSGSAVKDLGCSMGEFKTYLESKFEPWMNWENHGPYDINRDTWHIDHIVPLIDFNLSNREELLKACNYTNLRPYKALDNLKKGSKNE